MKKIPIIHMYLSILILFVSIIVVININYPIYIGIILSLLYIFIVSFYYGYKLDRLIALSKNSFLTIKNVILMMTLLGLIIPLWMSIGTIPSLVSFGFKYLSKTNVVLAAFLLCSILSLTLGSFIGTLSTLITVFLGLASGMNIPLPLIVGAAVSGSIFGDRTSPVSSNLFLIASSCDSPVRETLKSMFKTTLPSFIITAMFYFFLGQKYILKNSRHSDLIKYINILENNFVTNYYVFIPIIVLFSLILIFKKDIVYSLLISLFFSISIFIFQFHSFKLLFKTMIWGFHPSNQIINKIISGSGLLSMLTVVFVIFLSNYLNNLLSYTNLIEPVLNNFSKKISNFKSLIYKTTLLSIIVTAISCNQSLNSIITGNHFKSIYQKNKVPNHLLSRTIADTGNLIVPLIPWNANALVVVSLTGISTMSYFKYTFYSFIPLIITLVYPLFFYKNYSNFLEN